MDTFEVAMALDHRFDELGEVTAIEEDRHVGFGVREDVRGIAIEI